MQALLLIAHGSRREASNQEVRDLAARLSQTPGSRFDLVVPAFLELADPDIPSGVGQCAAAGSDTVTAVPYFLAAGRHVATDIPEELEKASHQYPHLQIRQSDYLGKHEDIHKILMTLALEKKHSDMEPQINRQDYARHEVQ